MLLLSSPRCSLRSPRSFTPSLETLEAIASVNHQRLLHTAVTRTYSFPTRLPSRLVLTHPIRPRYTPAQTLLQVHGDGALLAQVDLDRLDLHVVLECVLSELSADARLLEPAKGDLRVELVVAVDPDGAGLEVGGDSVRAGEIAGEDARGETVVCVVGRGDDLVLGVERRHDDDGAENLLADDFHVVGDVAENGGLDKVALLAVTVTAGEDLGTFLLAALDIVHDAVVLGLGDLGALVRVGVEGVADFDLRGDVGELLGELVVDSALDKEAGTGALPKRQRGLVSLAFLADTDRLHLRRSDRG
jgi:hypothetical protein